MYDNFVCSLACHALISQDRHLPYQWVIHRCREFSQHFIKNPHLEPERLTVRPPWKQKELQSSNFENWNLFTARRQKNRNVEKTSLKYVNKQKYSSDQKKKKKSIQSPKPSSPSLLFSQSKLFSISLGPFEPQTLFLSPSWAPSTPFPYLSLQSVVLSFSYTDTTRASTHSCWMMTALINYVKQWRHVSKEPLAIWKRCSD